VKSRRRDDIDSNRRRRRFVNHSSTNSAQHDPEINRRGAQMNLSKSFGMAFADGILDGSVMLRPDRIVDHRLDGPARFWADPPPGEMRIAA